MFSRPTQRTETRGNAGGAADIRTIRFGVGPNMVEVYADYRDPDAVQSEPTPPQRPGPTAERGLPALAAWLAFIVVLVADLARSFRAGNRFLAATALAAVVSMLAAGMFEYNFGDSEFLMLFLVLITLPFAAARSTTGRPSLSAANRHVPVERQHGRQADAQPR
jgi:hypothetical protein